MSDEMFGRFQAILHGASTRPYYKGKGTAAAGSNDAYPVHLSADDPRDEAMELRKSLIKDGGIAHDPVTDKPVGLAIADDRVFDYYNAKKQKELYAGFEKWMFEIADTSTPANQEYWYGHLPFLRDKKLATLNQQAQVQHRFAEMQITGPQSVDDWMLLYAYKQGLVQLSDKPLHKLSEDAGLTAQTGEDFRAGLFSPISTFYNTKDYPLRTDNSADAAVAFGQPNAQATHTTQAGEPPWGSLLKRGAAKDMGLKLPLFLGGK